MFLPLLIRRLGWKKSFQYFSIVGITILILFAPLLNEVFINNFGNSLDLYFQKFEFNASIYYLLRWLLFQITGYNQIATIGPLLGLTILTGIIVYVLKEQQPSYKNLFLGCLFAFSLYVFLATTVHPWYTILPLTLCIFTNFRFPIVWTGFAFLTYINYSYPVYHENMWIVGLEYFAVYSVLIWELSNYHSANKKLEFTHS
jgi:hypothetical protein